jgi:hypothetical protein
MFAWTLYEPGAVEWLLLFAFLFAVAAVVTSFVRPALTTVLGWSAVAALAAAFLFA